MAAKKSLKDVFADLHYELASILHRAVTTKYQDETGKDVPPPAAILNVARQLLKDNRIDAVPVEGTPLQKLSVALPFDEDGTNSMEVH